MPASKKRTREKKGGAEIIRLNFRCVWKAAAGCSRRDGLSFRESGQLRVELRSSPTSPRNRGLSCDRSPCEPEQIITPCPFSRRRHARLRRPEPGSGLVCEFDPIAASSAPRRLERASIKSRKRHARALSPGWYGAIRCQYLPQAHLARKSDRHRAEQAAMRAP